MKDAKIFLTEGKGGFQVTRLVADYKEVYRLWIEYLREGEYIKYCEEHAGERIKTLDEVLTDGVKRSISMTKGRNRSISLDRMYDVFGDIRLPDFDFEAWWNNRMMPLLTMQQDSRAIRQMIDKVNSDEIKERLVALSGKSITVNTVGRILDKFFAERAGLVFLRIPTFCPSKMLSNEFEDIIKNHKNEYGITKRHEKRYSMFFIPMVYPRMPTNEQIKACKESLAIFRAYKADNVTFGDVIKQIQPGAFDTYGLLSPMHYLESDFSKANSFAQRIINNAVRGIFPGSYRKSR